MKISDLIVDQDRQYIALNKPAALPCHPDQTKDFSLRQLAESYSKQTLYPINRIDRPASGIVLFGKTHTAAAHFNQLFQERKVLKTYLCVVGNMPEEHSSTLNHFLRTSRHSNKSIALDVPEADSKEAVLNYQYVSSIDRYHLLMVKLITGRRHQIRSQFAHIGSPIKGDVKYGFRRANKDRSIHLHAFQIRFAHPTKGQTDTLTAPVPNEVVWNSFLATTANEELIVLSQQMMENG